MEPEQLPVEPEQVECRLKHSQVGRPPRDPHEYPELQPRPQPPQCAVLVVMFTQLPPQQRSLVDPQTECSAIAGVLLQVPPLHRSGPVHALPSLHAAPFVVRLQAPVWLLLSTTQVPASQRGVVTVRERVPTVLHGSAPKPPQDPQAPVPGAPQSAFAVHSSQLDVASLQNIGQVGFVSEHAPSPPQRSFVVQ